MESKKSIGWKIIIIVQFIIILFLVIYILLWINNLKSNVWNDEWLISSWTRIINKEIKNEIIKLSISEELLKNIKDINSLKSFQEKVVVFSSNKEKTIKGQFTFDLYLSLLAKISKDSLIKLENIVSKKQVKSFFSFASASLFTDSVRKEKIQKAWFNTEESLTNLFMDILYNNKRYKWMDFSEEIDWNKDFCKSLEKDNLSQAYVCYSSIIFIKSQSISECKDIEKYDLISLGMYSELCNDYYKNFRK